MVEQREGGGHGGIYAILVIIVILIVGAIIYFSGVLGERGGTPDRIEADVEIDAPSVPAEGGGEPD